MGIYDRDYYGDQRRGLDLSGPRSMVVTLILINLGVYVVMFLLGQNPPGRPPGALYSKLLLPADFFSHPWTAWQLLTYGFLHAREPMHVAVNMFGLYIFGRDVETVYGRKAFLWMYLTAIVFSGLVWLASTTAVGGGSVVGASGAVTAVVMLFIFHFPKRTILLFFVLPMPAWVLGVLFIAADAFGALGGSGPNVVGSKIAFTAHLGGALYGFIFYKTGWSLGRIVPSGINLKSLTPKPKLRIHDPDESEQLDSEVDRILAKISRQGEDSLTRRERRLLEEASRRAQQRRRGP